MRRIVRTAVPALLALGLTASAARAQYMVYGVTSAGQLVRFDSALPSAVTTIGPLGFNLTGLDFRPATGELYGYNGTQLFTVNMSTGAASAVATVGQATSGTGGFDFNPTVDRIRIVDLSSGTNLRVVPAGLPAGSPAPGSLANGVPDGAYVYQAGDAAAGLTPALSGVAYTNSFAGATMTTLYGIDATRGTLVEVLQPNGGNVRTVGSLGLGTSLSGLTGFDIVTVGGANLGFFTTVSQGVTNFYSINLGTGAASVVGQVGGQVTLQGIAIAPAVVPEPGTWAMLGVGLAGLAGAARRRARRGA
jgi:hypothetical protein